MMTAPVGGVCAAQDPQPVELTDEQLAALTKQVSEGDMEAAVQIGIFYEEIEKDPHEASKWYSVAAENGNLVGMHRLAKLYSSGKGVPLNGRKAEKWLKIAAEQNYGPAQSSLGDLYMDGYILPKNEELAIEWYAKAAEQGDKVGEYYVGLRYMNGEGNTNQDYAAAAQWFKRSADQGYAPAQAHLGLLFQYGYGVKQDMELAYELFLRAAEQGNNEGLFWAGQALLNQKDSSFHAKGFDYVLQAAEKGYQPAMDIMPSLYQQGLGTAPNVEEAYKWSLILYELTPVQSKRRKQQMNNNVHYLADYLDNRQRAKARQQAYKWIRDYQERIGFHVVP